MKNRKPHPVKRMVAAALAILSLTALLPACKEYDADDPYPYDLSEYITVPSLKTLKYPEAEAEKETDIRINEFLWQNKLFERSEDGTAEKYNKAVVDYSYEIDGVPFNNEAVEIYLGNGNYLEQLENGIIGMTVGETKDIPVVFPEDYIDNLTGKSATFKVTLRELYKLHTLTDDICTKHTRFKNVTEMCETVRQTVISDYAWTTLYEVSEVKKYPEKEYNEAYEGLLIIEKYAEEADMSLQEYLNKYGDSYAVYGVYSGMTTAQFYEAAKSYTEVRIKEDMLMYYLIRELDVSDSGSKYRKMEKQILADYQVAGKEEYEDRYGEGSFYTAVMLNLMLVKLADCVEMI